MAVIADTIEIETLGANHIFPLPNDYEKSYWLPSVVATNAAGKPFVQAVGPVALREWTLTWFLMTESDMLLAQSAWDGLSSQICRYEDIFGDVYPAMRHPDQDKLSIEMVKAAAGIRWRVTMRLIKTTEAYEN